MQRFARNILNHRQTFERPSLGYVYNLRKGSVPSVLRGTMPGTMRGVFIQGHNEISYSRSTSKDKKWKSSLDELFHT